MREWVSRHWWIEWPSIVAFGLFITALDLFPEEGHFTTWQFWASAVLLGIGLQFYQEHAVRRKGYKHRGID